MRRAPSGVELGDYLAHLGERYTFTHTAARGLVERYHPGTEDPDSRLTGRNSVLGIIWDVANNKVDSGVVPYQNIVGGRVPEVVDGLYRCARDRGVKVVDSINVPIEMCMGGRCEPSDVRRVVSKDKALEQCSILLGERFPDAAWEAADSTVAGLNLIRDGAAGYENAAALASREAFEAYGEHGIRMYDFDGQTNAANIHPNWTRFLLIKGGREIDTAEGKRIIPARCPAKSKAGTIDVTTIAVEPCRSYRHLTGDLLSLAGDHGVGIRYQYSRPTGKDTEVVYLDLSGHRNDGNVSSFFHQLSKGSFGERVMYTLIGTYPFDEFFEPQIRRIAVVGGTPELNAHVARFFDECGYSTVVDSGHERQVRDSDVIVVNRAGRTGPEDISQIQRHLPGNGKLLVVNSSNLGYLAGRLPELCSADNVLFMDAPLAKRAPVRGQNVIFIGDGDFNPGSVKAEFVAIYEDMGARVTFTNFGKHELYRGFATQGTMLGALVYLEWARRNGVDLAEARRYTSPPEQLFMDLAQKIVNGDPEVLGKALHRYLHEHGDELIEAAHDLFAGGEGPAEDVVGRIRDTIGTGPNIQDATARITDLYDWIIGSGNTDV